MTITLKPLREQTIVVTGATSGIGLSIAAMAAGRGARVVLVARSEDDLKKVRAGIEEAGGRADHIVADTGRREDMRRVVETTVDRFGGFDTWVNNAGVGAYATLCEMSDEDHEQIFRTNYWGVVYGSTEALRHLRRRGGALVNIGSIASDIPTPILGAYAASKHAVKGFTNSLRLELQQEEAPVSVTLIKPSGIDTPFPDHAANRMEDGASLPPPVYHPDEVAKAVLRAAEVPMREVVIGGAGAMQTAMFGVLPALTERIIRTMFYNTAMDPEKAPKRGEDGFSEPGEGGHQLGSDDTWRRGTSLYTAARLNPGVTAGLAAAAGAAALAAVAARRR